jgi:hypothetical protein
LKKLKTEVIEHSDKALNDNKDYSLIKLSSITNFKWNKFVVFEEYVTSKQISEIIGITWEGENVPSGNRRILFISENKVVKYIDIEVESFPLWIYTCSPINQQYVFDKRDDLFAVFKSNRNKSQRYQMVPYRCIDGFKYLFK